MRILPTSNFKLFIFFLILPFMGYGQKEETDIKISNEFVDAYKKNIPTTKSDSILFEVFNNSLPNNLKFLRKDIVAPRFVMSIINDLDNNNRDEIILEFVLNSSNRFVFVLYQNNEDWHALLLNHFYVPKINGSSLTIEIDSVKNGLNNIITTKNIKSKYSSDRIVSDDHAISTYKLKDKKLYQCLVYGFNPLVGGQIHEANLSQSHHEVGL